MPRTQSQRRTERSSLVDLEARGNSAFRLSAAQLFLTYPQCEIAPIILLELLKSLPVLSAHTIEDYVIAQEDHQDLAKHLHVYLRQSSKLNLKDAKKLDVTHESRGYHPNIQGCRSAKACLAYVTKGGIYISSRPIEEIQSQNATWADILKSSNSAAEFHAALLTAHPRDYVLHLTAVEQFARKKWPSSTPNDSSSWDPNSWAIPDALENWLSRYWIVSVHRIR
jgi:hypothetical protein